jgi:tetratricopeptide (TPR) repeat protein
MNIKEGIFKILFSFLISLFLFGSAYPLWAQGKPASTKPAVSGASAKKNQVQTDKASAGITPSNTKMPPASGDKPKQEIQTGLQEKAAEKKETEKTSPVIIKDADYWFNKGVLFAVYGNQKAAIASFKKAIELAPQWSSAYFQLGVAYGEIGKYDVALKEIDRAIELDAQKGAYYYGRGRVLLLSGNYLKAQEDFKKAAALGDYDARRYLEKQPP